MKSTKIYFFCHDCSNDKDKGVEKKTNTSKLQSHKHMMQLMCGQRKIKCHGTRTSKSEVLMYMTEQGPVIHWEMQHRGSHSMSQREVWEELQESTFLDERVPCNEVLKQRRSREDLWRIKEVGDDIKHSERYQEGGKMYYTVRTMSGHMKLRQCFLTENESLNLPQSQ